VPTVNGAAREIVLSFQTGALVNQTYTATITAKHGGNTVTFFVKATVSLMNVSKLVADPLRARVYGLHQSGTAAGAVIVYDPFQETLVGSISAGRKPTDLAISNDGSELFVINSVDRSITVIDLNTLRLKETILLATFDNWGESDTSANLKVGSGNIIYYTDGGWAPTLRVFDRVSRQVLQSVLISPSSYGFGDFALTPDKKTLIGWVQYGWTAGWAGSYLARFNVNDNGTVTQVETTDSNYPTVLNRDPLDTPLLISNDGQIAFAKQLAVKASSIKQLHQTFPTQVYSITPGGEVAVTKNSIFETATANKLLDLPVATGIQAITADYARLVYYNTTQRTFGSLKLIEAIGDDILNQTLFPSDGAIILSPAALRWQSVPGAQKYRIYLGTNKQEVGSATEASPLYLGETSTSFFNLSGSLAPGVTYYWRIDTVSSSGVFTSDIHNFTVSEISASVNQMETATVKGHAHHVVPVDLASENPGKGWQASSPDPWISFAQNSGVTPATLQVVLDASALAPGLHNGSISISGSAGGPFVIPVKLRVDALSLTFLKSDPNSSLVYAISENTASPVGGAYLLELDSASETLLRVKSVGSSVTDLAFHSGDHRIYVPNWKSGILLAIDSTTFEQVRSYNFSAYPNSSYNNDVYRVTPGAGGRLLIEEYDQWIDISLFNTVSGTTITKNSQRQGGGATDPTGRYYYHGDDNSSDAGLHKFELTGDTFTHLSKVRINPLGYYGSRIVVASEDGSRIFWNGMAFDANLNPVRNLADYIFSATRDGHYSFGEKLIYDTESGQVAFGMPADTTVSAFNSTTGKLVAQVGTSVRFYTLQPTSNLPMPALAAQVNSDGSITLSWSDNSLETGFTLQRRIAGTTDWQDVTPALGRNTTSTTLRNLPPGTNFEFRIKADSPAATSDWSSVAAITVPASSAARLANISTRVGVGTSDNATIAGFIITGSAPAKVMIRGMGPSLGAVGVADPLSDPLLELHYPNNTVFTNDDWSNGDTTQIPAGFAPANSKESVIVATLPPGTYTTVLRGAHAESGVGLVEVYHLDPDPNGELANISTRGFVQNGSNVLIGGLILNGGTVNTNVIIRAIGPSLGQFGISNYLVDPVVSLYNGNGTLVQSNDNWKVNSSSFQSQEALVTATGLAPSNDLESAIVITLQAGQYTAVVAGKNGGTGVGLVEVYNLH
jgi:hypothetical protein